jgi:hypothetical protein
MRLVLDAEAVNALLDPRHPHERTVRRAMEAARRLRREVAIATGTLAELYRGAGRNHGLDALLARELGDGLLLRDTDRSLARLIGALLAEAGGSQKRLTGLNARCRTAGGRRVLRHGTHAFAFPESHSV